MANEMRIFRYAVIKTALVFLFTAYYADSNSADVVYEVAVFNLFNEYMPVIYGKSGHWAIFV